MRKYALSDANTNTQVATSARRNTLSPRHRRTLLADCIVLIKRRNFSILIMCIQSQSLIQSERQASRNASNVSHSEMQFITYSARGFSKYSNPDPDPYSTMGNDSIETKKSSILFKDNKKSHDFYGIVHIGHKNWLSPSSATKGLLCNS